MSAIQKVIGGIHLGTRATRVMDAGARGPRSATTPLTRVLAAVFTSMSMLLVLASPASARGSNAFAWSNSSSYLSSTYWQGQIEQQSPDWFSYRNCNYSGSDTCVYRPPSSQCIWSDDDGVASWSNNGSLAAGATTSTSRCMYADGGGYLHEVEGNHRVEVLVQAPTTTLAVSVQGSTGQTYNLTPVANSGQYPYVPSGGYLWVLCARDATPGPYPAIAGSVGNGVGTEVTYTLTIKATQTKGSVSNVWAALQMGWITQFGEPGSSASRPPIC